mgnify:CR=1 FL=1
MSSFSLPKLDYDFGALEPAISGQIMEVHYNKHHQAYVTNLNIGMEKLKEAEAKNDVSSIITLQQNIKFNGGGHINHSIFWKNLTPISKGGGVLPDGELTNMIKSQYGSLENLQTVLTNTCIAVQESGWGWLGYDKVNKKLAITACANQYPLQATTGLVPLLGIDVWEHAYYLQYKNVRYNKKEAKSRAIIVTIQ